MFHSPLPQDIITALTAILNIDDDDDTLDDMFHSPLLQADV
jgi:hypothetical protein